MIKQWKMRNEEAVRRLEEIFGNGSGQEIEIATAEEKIEERIEEMSKDGKNGRNRRV